MIDFDPDRITPLPGEYIDPTFPVPPDFFFGAGVIAEGVKIPLEPGLDFGVIGCPYF